MSETASPGEPAPPNPGTGGTALSADDAATLLTFGTLEVEGRLVDASNATLFCSVSYDGVDAQCVYKPVQGERPLWDFPDGTLAEREVAAFVVSEATGWDIVPPTVHRHGPFGPGMCQLWMEPELDVDLVELARGQSPQIRRMVVFDAVVNNSDRKGGHLLPQADGHVFGCDHGICFHAEDKLRTVLWSFAGDPLDDESSETLTALAADLGGTLGEQLSELLTRREVTATRRRIARMLHTGRFPEPSNDWPAIPWPPF